MSSNHYKAICFDAGNTLLYCDPSPAEIYADELSRHGRRVTPDEVEPAFREAWAEMQRQTASGTDRYAVAQGGEREWWGAFVQEVLHRLDHDADWRPLLDELWQAFARPEVWKAYPEARFTLDELRRRNIPLAVISNWDRRLPTILENLGFTPSFDVITVSSLVGYEKPSGEIFRLTLEQLGISASETIHIGDSPLEDYRGAADAGLMPLLIDRNGLFTEQPYRRITSLSEVIGLLSLD